MLLINTFLIGITAVLAKYVHDEEAERFFFESMKKPKQVGPSLQFMAYTEESNSTYFYDYDQVLYDTRDGKFDSSNLISCQNNLVLSEAVHEFLCDFNYQCMTKMTIMDFDGVVPCKREWTASPGRCGDCHHIDKYKPMGEAESEIFIGFFDENSPRSNSMSNGIVFKNDSKHCLIGSTKSTNEEDCPKNSIIVHDPARFFDVVGKGYTVDNSVQLVFDNQWVKSISSYSCLNSSNKDCTANEISSCRVGSCRGDLSFCNVFGCNGQVSCHCTYNLNTTEKLVKSNNALGTFKSSSKLKAFSYMPRPSISTGEPACYGIAMSCDRSEVIIVQASLSIISVRLMRSPWDIFYRITEDEEKITKRISMPIEMASLSSSINAEIWVKGYSMPCNMSFDCPEVKICDTIDCFFCKISWAAVNCYDSGHWAILIIGSLILSLPFYLVLRLLGKIIKAILWNNKVIKNMIIYSWLKLKQLFIWIKRKLYKISMSFSKDFDRLKEIENKMNELKETQTHTKNNATTFLELAKEERKVVNLTRNQQRIKNNLLKLQRLQARNSSSIVIISLFAIILSVLGCSEINTFSVDNNACTTSATGSTTCTVRQSMILSAAPIGQYACFNVNSPEGKSMGSVQVKFTSMNVRCVSYKMYYVPDVIPWPVSYFRCDEAGDCNAAQCNSVQANPEKLDSIAYVQDHKGKRINGGCSFVTADGIFTGDGCFHDHGCLYWSLAMKKKTEKVIEQSACGSWEFVMNAEVSVLSMSNSFSTMMELVPGSTSTVDENLHFSLISASIPPTSLTDQCIGKSERQASIYSCNKKDSLIPGLIGELQCPTEASAVSLAGCFSAAGSFEVTTNSKGLVVKSHLIDAWRVFDSNVLPYNISNGITVFQNSKGEILTTFPGTSLTQIALTIDNLRLTYVSSKSSCSISSISLTGCFSCVNGADWKFVGRTDFGSAVATIKCPSINFMTIIALKETSTEGTVKINMVNGEIEANCFVECPGGSTNFVLKGSLDWIPPEDPRDNSTATGVSSTAGSGSFWNEAWLRISSYVYWAVGIILFIMIIIGLIMFIRTVVIPYMEVSKTKKLVEKIV